MNPQEEAVGGHALEEEFLLTVLQDFCAGRKTPRPDPLPDMAALARIAEAHSLGSLAYSQCRRWAGMMPGAGALHRDFLNDAFLSVNRREVLREIIGAFSEEGIPVILMKGAVIRDYYPEPALRSMGDIDFVVRHEDREKSDRIMTEVLGFRKLVAEHAVWNYSLGQIMVEIHEKMFYKELGPEVDLTGYFDRVWEHCRRGQAFGIGSDCLYIPEEEFHFVYLMAHTAKHVVTQGSGFRAYLDMVMAVRSTGGTMDWKRIGAELEKLRLLTFTKTCFSLCKRWFGVRMPYDREPLDEDFYQEVTEKTFADGVFGLDNRANETAGVAQEIGRSEDAYGVAAVKLGIRKFFPSYGNMQITPWYSWVDGKPYLLPAAWAYRLGYCTVKKFRASIHKLEQPFTERAEIESRQRLLRKWGL